MERAASSVRVIGFTKALAIEYATRSITANNVAPGFVDTEGLRASPVNVEDFAQKTPMKRPGKPEDIAAAVAYLASDAAGYVIRVPYYSHTWARTWRINTEQSHDR